MTRGLSRRVGGALVLVLGLLLPTAAPAQHFPPDPELELMLRFLVEDGATPGIVLGVVDPDGSARAVVYGRDGDGARVSPRTIFDLGALTMTFTATLLADMVARGEVSLEDAVASYLPPDVEVPSFRGREITLLDLATHRSGLPADRREGVPDLTVAELYDLLARHRLDADPGRFHRFSSTGYGLLGLALARAAGVDYEELLRERVLDPLGMSRTGYASGRATAAAPPEVMQGATGLRSTGEDLLRFLAANVGPPATELERAMRAAHEVRHQRRHEGLGYGFSWRTQSVAGQAPIVTHGGRSAAGTSMIAFDHSGGIGTLVLASDPAFTHRIGRQLLFFGPPASEAEARVDPSLLRLYHGTYRSNVGRYRANLRQGRHIIRLEDEGYLTYQAHGRERMRLYAASDTEFYALRMPFTLTFQVQGDHVRLAVRVDEREEGGGGWTAWKVGDRTPPSAVVAGNAAAWLAWGPAAWALLALVTAVTMIAVWRSVRPRVARGAGSMA